MQREGEQQDDLTPADRELEAALKSLSPSRATRIDPVAAAFAAGARSARRQLRFWQSAAAAVFLLAAGTWLVPFHRAADARGPTVATTPPMLTTPPRPVDSIPATIATAPPTAVPVASPAETSGHSLFVLERAVRENGLAGLPPTDLPSIQNLRPADLF